MVLEKTLKSPMDCKEIQPVLKEISPGCSLKGLMLKLKLQYFGHLMRRADSLEKTLMLGKIEGRRRGRQRMRWLDGITDSMDMRVELYRKLSTEELMLLNCGVEKTLESPLDCKEISPGYSLEGLMLKLKLQYFDVKS